MKSSLNKRQRAWRRSKIEEIVIRQTHGDITGPCDCLYCELAKHDPAEQFMDTVAPPMRNFLRPYVAQMFGVYETRH